jgi:hypothetical protein
MTGHGEWSKEQPPCRRLGQRGRRPARHRDGAALTREERRRFDEIASRIEHEAVTVDPPLAATPVTTQISPVRLAAVGLFVIGAAGVLTGLIGSDLVILTVHGVVPMAGAAILVAFAGESETADGAPVGPATGRREQSSLLTRFHSWLTTCATNGCGNRAILMGWCNDHAPAYDPGPDEYWGEPRDDAP